MKKKRLTRLFSRSSTKLRSGQHGQGMVEYAVLLGLLALAVVGAVTLSTQGVDTATQRTTSDIGNSGANFTPGEAITLPANSGPQPTRPNAPTPANTPIPPTATSTPTNTPIPGPTDTLAPTNTPKPTNTPTPTITPNATQTAAAFDTIAAQASGGAVRYRVDPNGWNNSSDGFCNGGTAGQSGNQGLNTITLAGDSNDVFCFRIDTYDAGMTINTETHDFDITYQSGSGSPGYVQMTLTKQAKYTTNITVITNVLFTKQSYSTYSSVVPFYLMVKMPTDICTTKNNYGDMQFKARDDSNSHGVKISTICQPRPTATVTNTPAPTATPTMTATPKPATPTPTPNDGQS